MLGKGMCKASRKSAFLSMPGSIQTHCDYAEHLTERFNLEIQSSHFGNNCSLSIEGCTIEHHLCDNKMENKSNSEETKLVFYSHFADESAQIDVTTNAHMCVVLQHYMHAKKFSFEEAPCWKPQMVV